MTFGAVIKSDVITIKVYSSDDVLNISYKDHVTSKEVRNRIQNAIGMHDDLLIMVKKRKLRWYGHISRSSGMSTTFLQGTAKGARRRGSQKKRWEDNIKEWTGMGFGDSLRTAEDREGWKGIVATSPTTSEVKGLRWDGMSDDVSLWPGSGVFKTFAGNMTKYLPSAECHRARCYVHCSFFYLSMTY